MKFTLDSFVNRNAAVWAELMRYLTSSSNKEFEARVVSWMQAFNVRGIGNQVVPVRHTLGQELLDLMRVCTTSPLMPMTKVKIMVETAADIFTTNTMVEHVSAYLAHRIVQDLLVEYSLKEDELAGAEILGRSTYELYLTLTNIIENHGLIHADIRIVDKDAEAVSELMHKLDILRQDLSLRKKEVTLAVSTHPQRESSEQAEELILDDAELTLGALPDKQIAKEMLPDEKVRLLLSRYIEEIQRIQVLCAYARVALSPVESHVSLQKMVVLYREIMGHLIEQSEYAAELNESGSEENNSRGKDDTEIATKERLLEPCDFAEFAQVFKDIYQIQTALTSKGIDLQQSRVELKEEKRKLEVNNRECISSEEKIKQNIEEKIKEVGLKLDSLNLFEFGTQRLFSQMLREIINDGALMAWTIFAACRRYSNPLAVAEVTGSTVMEVSKVMAMHSNVGVLLEKNKISRPEHVGILIIGDSAAAGWGAEKRWYVDVGVAVRGHLADKIYTCAGHIRKACEVVLPTVSICNSSIPGATLAHGLEYCAQELDLYRPDVVVISLGGNDAYANEDAFRICQKILDIILNVRQHENGKSCRIVICFGIPHTFADPNTGYGKTLDAIANFLSGKIEHDLHTGELAGLAACFLTKQTGGLLEANSGKYQSIIAEIYAKCRTSDMACAVQSSISLVKIPEEMLKVGNLHDQIHPFNVDPLVTEATGVLLQEVNAVLKSRGIAESSEVDYKLAGVKAGVPGMRPCPVTRQSLYERTVIEDSGVMLRLYRSGYGGNIRRVGTAGSLPFVECNGMTDDSAGNSDRGVRGSRKSTPDLSPSANYASGHNQQRNWLLPPSNGEHTVKYERRSGSSCPQVKLERRSGSCPPPTVSRMKY